MSTVNLSFSNTFLYGKPTPKYLSIARTSSMGTSLFSSWFLLAHNHRQVPLESFYSVTRRINQVLALKPEVPSNTTPKLNEFNNYILRVRKRNSFIIRFFKTLILKAPSLIENEEMPLYENNLPLYSAIVKRYYRLSSFFLSGKNNCIKNRIIHLGLCLISLTMMIASPIFVIFRTIKNYESHQWKSRTYRMIDCFVSFPVAFIFATTIALRNFKGILLPKLTME